MTDIQRMKNQLKARKGHCTREANKVRTEITAEAVSHRTLLSAIQRLEDKYLSYQKAYDELDIALLDADDSSRDQVNLAFETYDTEIVMKKRLVIDKQINHHKPPPPLASQTAISSYQVSNLSSSVEILTNGRHSGQILKR